MSGSVWIASYVALWLTVLALAFAVVALLRQIGVLHARLHPLGVHFGGEGPDLGAVAPPVDGIAYGDRELTLLAFTSPTCAVCAVLRPSIDAVSRAYRDVQVAVLDLDDASRDLFASFNVRSTPYVVVVGRDATVRGRGVANSLEQIEELLEEARVEAA